VGSDDEQQLEEEKSGHAEADKALAEARAEIERLKAR
jgi:hypothetical protein